MKIVSAMVGGLVLILIFFGLWFNHLVSTPISADKTQKTIMISGGDGVKMVADKLLAAGLIRQRWHWNFYMVISGKRSSIIPDEYHLARDQTVRQLATTLTTEPTGPKEVTVKLLEGWTVKAMADVLDRAGVVDRQAWLDAVAAGDTTKLTAGKQYLALKDKPAAASFEGYLFPDTYRFFLDSTSSQVITKMVDNFEAKFTSSMRSQAATQSRTVFQEVTMASIVEAELKSDTDRAMAADIFWRRLDAGIALNADTTIHYALNKQTPLSLDDLKVDSPYNTYIHRGLPIGPIGNPGQSALRAALNPKANDYWYYLTGNDGKTYYAKTLEEHNANKAKYLK